jgi:Resolvase, N terminal domain
VVAASSTAWSYAAVSSSPQETTLEDQQRWARDAAASHGWVITREFSGIASGAKGTREILGTLIDELERTPKAARPQRVLMIESTAWGEWRWIASPHWPKFANSELYCTRAKTAVVTYGTRPRKERDPTSENRALICANPTLGYACSSRSTRDNGVQFECSDRAPGPIRKRCAAGANSRTGSMQRFALYARS